MSDNHPLRGMVPDIRQLFGLTTKFILGLAGAPFEEICKQRQEDKDIHAPEDTAGVILVVSILLLLFGRFELDTRNAVTASEVTNFSILGICLSLMAVLLPWRLFVNVSRTEAVYLAVIYWLPWFAVAQAAFSFSSQLAPFLFFVPILTLSTGIWERRYPSHPWQRFLGVPFLATLVAIGGILIMGAMP